MKIYEFTDYKIFLNKWIESQPKRGHGLLSKIAQKLQIHTTLLSHTIRGDKNLSLEQAAAICEFLGLNVAETDYFILLVQIERSGTALLKKKFRRDLDSLKSKVLELSTRLPSDTALTEEQKTEFYSSWLYAAIRQLSSLKDYQTRTSLAAYFSIRKVEVDRVINFLIATGLCKEKGGRIEIGPNKTHLEATSPLVYLHHKNWRIKAFEKHNNLSAEELMYSAPFTISHDDFSVFKGKVVRLIEELVAIADTTKPERLASLNIDLTFVND